jgi:hypothetical protein
MSNKPIIEVDAIGKLPSIEPRAAAVLHEFADRLKRVRVIVASSPDAKDKLDLTPLETLSASGMLLASSMHEIAELGESIDARMELLKHLRRVVDYQLTASREITRTMKTLLEVELHRAEKTATSETQHG